MWAAGGLQLELHPVGPGHFYCKEIQADMEFSPQENGGMHVKITQPGGAINESDRIPAAAAAVDLQPYAGVYWSDELETQYTFLVRDGALYAHHAHHGEIVLSPTVKDEFATGWWFTPHVKFSRDTAGTISGVTLGGGRVVGITFTRKPSPTIQEAARRKFEKH